MPGPRPQTRNGKTKSNLIIEPVPGPSRSTGLSAPIDPAPQGPDASDRRLAVFQSFVLSVERGNLMKKRLNAWRQERCGMDSIATVSDDEPEDPLPNIEDFADIALTLPQPAVDLETDPTGAAGGNADAVDPVSPAVAQPDSVTRPAGPIDWATLLTTAQGDMNVSSTSPLLTKPAIDWESLGPVFLDDEALSNAAELNPTGFPDALLMMMHLRLFIPLSMLTTAAIARIRFNEDLKFKKIPFGPAAGKYALDDTYFPTEATLSDFDYMQAHRHWTDLIKATMQTAIYEGWKAHHEQMVGDEHLRTSARAWRKHDRNLRAQFMIRPYIIDPTSVIYNQQYERVRVNLLSDAFESTSTSRGEPPNHRYPVPSSSASFRPYDKDRERKSSSSFRNTREAQPVLCIRCGRWGHRASVCRNNDSTRSNHPIIVSWKVDKLVSKHGRHICILFNVRGNCSSTSSSHPEHSCSLCGDLHHGAANCSRN